MERSHWADMIGLSNHIKIWVRYGTEHEYGGERGWARDREMGGKTEKGEVREIRDTEMGGKIAWLYTLQAKLFPRTEWEQSNREAKRGNHSSNRRSIGTWAKASMMDGWMDRFDGYIQSVGYDVPLELTGAAFANKRSEHDEWMDGWIGICI
jgi:hypothetical protein